MSHPLFAVQQIRRLRGGSQAQLLRASDGRYYVTKSAQNPQHVRVLANEMLATRLGQLLGLPVPRVESIEVSDWLIEHTSELTIDIGGSHTLWKPGVHLASLYVDGPATSQVFDYLPESLMDSVRNLADFARALCLIGGPAIAMAGRRSSLDKEGARTDTSLPSSTRAIVSTRASGVFLILLCAESTPETAFTRTSRIGMRSSQHSLARSKWMSRKSGKSPLKFPRSGTNRTTADCTGSSRISTSGAA
jgi:hypothetical protein